MLKKPDNQMKCMVLDWIPHQPDMKRFCRDHLEKSEYSLNIRYYVLLRILCLYRECPCF